MRAKYTEVLIDLMLNEQTKPLLDKALSTYPIYEPEKQYDMIPNRSELNKKILNHYKYREIGFETVGRFLDELEITMCEIMPKYNELFKTVAIMSDIKDPFGNVDVTEQYEEERSGSTSSESYGSGTSSSESKDTSKTSSSGIDEQTHKKVHSDTPQGVIGETAKLMEDITHASDVEWYKANNSNDSEIDVVASGTGETESTTSSTSSGTNVERITHTFTKTGNQGVNTYAHDMVEFRTSIRDIVDEIIHDDRLNELFMLVY